MRVMRDASSNQSSTRDRYLGMEPVFFFFEQ
jgi:hypothetical protein